MNIKKDIMASSRNYTSCRKRNIQYIVIHGTGHVAPCKNFALNLKNNKCSGSAHYFVGDGEIRQVIDDNNIAWHVGNPKGVYKVKNSKCVNANSIGIEMCETNVKTGAVTDSTIKLTGELVRMLMKKYNIPSSCVIRHNDVLSKPCPTGFLTSDKWNKLKEQLVNGLETTTSTKMYIARCNTNGLNCRTGAGVDYDVEMIIHKGQVFTVVQEVKAKDGGIWVRSKSGYYVNKKYIDFVRYI